MKKFMMESFHQMDSEEDLLLCYWMVELPSVNKDTSKEKLDKIIEPKLRLNKPYIEQRIKELN